MTRRASLAVLAAAAVACAAPSSAAAAQQERAGADPGFAVAAVGFESYFKYRLRPGARRSGKIRVVSRSATPQVVVLRAADVMTAATGGLEYGATEPRTIGTWIELEDEMVTVAPGRAVEVPFTLRVPEDAKPGDHLAGLVAINREQSPRRPAQGGEEGFSLRFLPRLAIAVQTTVPGEASSELTVGNIGLDVRPTTTDVTVLIRNSGDRLIPKTGGRLTVMRGGRVLLQQQVDLDAFVPGTNVRYRLPLTGVPARGTYEVSGELLPKGAPPVPVNGSASFAENEADALEEQTGQQPIGSGPSTLLIVLIAAGALALLLMAAALLRMRRRLEEARSGAAVPPVGGA